MNTTPTNDQITAGAAVLSNNGKREGFEAAAKALQERATGHFRNKNYALQDECLQCASMLHDLKPVTAPSPQIAEKVELPSIDTPEFQALVEGWRKYPYGTREFLIAWDAIIAHVDHAIAASRRATCLVPMRDDTFTVIPPNMREYPMSVREADMENDLFRVAFDDACKEDKPENAEQELFAWDFFRYGWEAAVRLLNDDAERAAAQGTGEQ